MPVALDEPPLEVFNESEALLVADDALSEADEPAVLEAKATGDKTRKKEQVTDLMAFDSDM